MRPFLILAMLLFIGGCSQVPIIPDPPRGEGYSFEAQGSVEFYGPSHELVQLKEQKKTPFPPQPTFSPGQSLRGQIFNPRLYHLWEGHKLRAHKKPSPLKKKGETGEK